MNERSGLTLIEVLIAVSLLSLLSVGVLWSMRIGFNTLDKTDTHLIHNRRVANSRRIIESVLDGYFPVPAAIHPKPGETSYLTFVQAEPSVMRFVTSYSLEQASRGPLQMTTLHVIEGDKSVGGVRLVMEEVPYAGPEHAGSLITGVENIPEFGYRLHFMEPASGSASFVLADGLEHCRFEYLQRLSIPPFQIWRTDWVSAYDLPRAVRVDMAPLHPEGADLHVSPVTVALPVTRQSTRRYSDE